MTMSHMKKISIRELHRNTGAWVRNARRYGSIIVSDRNTPVAQLIPLTEMPAVNRFEGWKPRKEFTSLLNRPVKGTPVEEIISQDRER